MAEIKEGRVKDLTPDDKNFNQHTDTGKAMLRKSIEQFGYGRSILVDKNDRIIGGNGVQEASDNAKTIIVETTGDELVVVKRTDIDLDSKKGREMALADNATAAADLSWNMETIDTVAGEWGINTEGWGVSNLQGGVIGIQESSQGNKSNDAEKSERQRDPESEIIVATVSLFGTTEDMMLTQTISKEDADKLIALAKAEGADTLMKRIIATL